MAPAVFGRSKEEQKATRNRRYTLQKLREDCFSEFKAYSESFGLLCPQNLELCTIEEIINEGDSKVEEIESIISVDIPTTTIKMPTTIKAITKGNESDGSLCK